MTTTPTPLPDRYQPATFETSRYTRWEAAGAFAARPDPTRAAFSMILPPPNITGSLHMGHAYEHTISDAFARYQRMRGADLLWAPGIDHAGIATQNIIERQLAADGLTRHAIGRERFIERAWAWKEASGGAILDQMRRLGASPDWDRLTFTLDPGPQTAVRAIFTRLFDDGLIYRAERIIGWCDRCTTALADIEIDTSADGAETCSRCQGHITRRSSLQWFLRTAPLAAAARDALTSARLRLEPASMHDEYLGWCDTMHDWCISRQLWWGHRLPIWYGPDGTTRSFAPGDDIPDGWTQDDDVLDTWFSSALWPLTCLGWPAQTADLARYYPTTLMCTGYDLIFFWALRMIMLCTYATGTPPFATLYLHGMIRDEHGKKMSKSFGNTIDPLELIERAGADPLRFALARHARPGADIPFGDSDLRNGEATAKKLWSITRFTLAQLADHPATAPAGEPDGLLPRWLGSRLEQTRTAATDAFDRFDLAGATDALTGFLHDDLSEFYIEAIRPTLRRAGSATDEAIGTLHATLRELLTLLHPIVPFLTEELADHLADPATLDMTPWPPPHPDRRDPAAEAAVDDLRAAITAARSYKADLGLEQSHLLPATIAAPHLATELAALARLEPADTTFTPAVTIRFGSILLGLPGASNLDTATRSRLTRRLADTTAAAANAAARLADPAFCERAPTHILERTRTQHRDATSTAARLTRILAT